MDVFENLLYLGLWLFLGIIAIVVILYATWGSKKAMARPGKYGPRRTNEHMDFDLRLPYKRFKELYPWTKITYQEYKKLQMERAFRRAVSSDKNKRMVR